MPGKRQDQFITIKEYTDARIGDLRILHKTDLENLQSEIDRRIETLRREIDLRFDQITDWLERMDQAREIMRDQVGSKLGNEIFDDKMKSVSDHLGRIDSSIDRQKGRVSAYATVSGIILVLIAILTLFVDHVRF